MIDIVAFVTARLDEEAVLAQRLLDRYVWPDNGVVEPERVGKPFWPSAGIVARLGGYLDPDIRAGLDLIRIYSPARVLAEVKAKRAIIDGHDVVYRNVGWLEAGDEEYGEIPVCGRCVPKHSHFTSRAEVPEWPCRTVRLLATPYDESWRP